ncbi:MAG TPA: LCP family protein, partial [Actinomycetota bacterium]|nr:LCP family protein [Actinomycetota bacterium]
FRLRAGPNHLDGNAALSFVRARYATGSGDFGRIQRQQQFLKAVVAKVGRPQILGRPDRVRALGRAFAQNVTVDQGFSLNEMAQFALKVRRVGVDQLTTLTVPGRETTINQESVVLMDRSAAEALFARLRNESGPQAQAAVKVAVEDASGKGLAASVARSLDEKGFDVVRYETVTTVQRETEVIAPKPMLPDADRLAAIIPRARVRSGGTELRLVLGSRFEDFVRQQPVQGAQQEQSSSPSRRISPCPAA